MVFFALIANKGLSNPLADGGPIHIVAVLPLRVNDSISHAIDLLSRLSVFAHASPFLARVRFGLA